MKITPTKPPESPQATGRENPVIQMFGRISPRYDLLNRLMTGGRDQAWRKQTIEELGLNAPPVRGARFLDLAAGTGDLGFALSQKLRALGANDYEIYLVDPSSAMLDLAQDKLELRPDAEHFRLKEAVMEQIPFVDGFFAAATIGFGIRNASDRLQALREARRVLVPGGRLAILEALTPPRAWQRRLHRLHMGLAVPVLAALFSEVSAYAYLGRSVAEFPSPAEFLELLKKTGFTDCRFKPLTFGAVGIFCAQAGN